MLKVELKASDSGLPAGRSTNGASHILASDARFFVLPCFWPKPVRWTRSLLIHSGDVMSSKRFSTAAVLGLALLALTACGNTIRGLGRDMGNAVDATQDAGRSVANSVK